MSSIFDFIFSLFSKTRISYSNLWNYIIKIVMFFSDLYFIFFGNQSFAPYSEIFYKKDSDFKFMILQ